MLIKNASILGIRAGEAVRRDPALGPPRQRDLMRLAEEGRISPNVSHRLPLERWAEAMRLLIDRKAIGRVALVMECERSSAITAPSPLAGEGIASAAPSLRVRGTPTESQPLTRQNAGDAFMPSPARGEGAFTCASNYSYFLSPHHGKYGGMSLLTLSVNFAGRFSRNDTTPSFTSLDAPRA